MGPEACQTTGTGVPCGAGDRVQDLAGHPRGHSGNLLSGQDSVGMGAEAGDLNTKRQHGQCPGESQAFLSLFPDLWGSWVRGIEATQSLSGEHLLDCPWCHTLRDSRLEGQEGEEPSFPEP